MLSTWFYYAAPQLPVNPRFTGKAWNHSAMSILIKILWKLYGTNALNQRTSGLPADRRFVHQRARCVKIASDFLAQGIAVAIGTSYCYFPCLVVRRRFWLIVTDNTNGDLETRAVWIRLSRNFGVPIRCVLLSAPPKLCEHNNTVRALAGDAFNPENRPILPYLAFSSFASRFINPSTTEGFEDIITLEFQVRDLYIIFETDREGKSNLVIFSTVWRRWATASNMEHVLGLSLSICCFLYYSVKLGSLRSRSTKSNT